ncbi:MAG TPA: site-2 protease family protein, partial [Chloroflexota bacterium]|nr:site-2 protease family protein [Chloroflexota bacterium]
MPEPYMALFGWLAAANAILAVFNLIPGFPMDGGRVVRALLWGTTGNLRRATQIAANVGRAIAYLFIAWGLLRMFGGNLSLAAIRLVPRHTWPTMRAMHVMQEPAKALTVAPDDSPAPVVERMVHEGISCGAVLDGDELVGVLDLETIMATRRLREEPGGKGQVPADRDSRQALDPGA